MRHQAQQKMLHQVAFQNIMKVALVGSGQCIYQQFDEREGQR